MSDRPYFLWDYNLTNEDVKRILREGDESSRKWIIGRILESAQYKDVWEYLSLKEVAEIFPKLRLKKPVRNALSRALKVWNKTK